MGISQRNNSEILDKMTRIQRAHEDHADAVATVQQFNARLSAKGRVWAWPTIAAALTSKHHWLVIACGSCGTAIDLDLRVKPRDAAPWVRCAWRGALPSLQWAWADTPSGFGGASGDLILRTFCH